jgi:hypothetical protein
MLYVHINSNGAAPHHTGDTDMNSIDIIARYNALRAEYADYAAEARACGHEAEIFEHWAGITSPRADAEARMIDIDSQYYHCD